MHEHGSTDRRPRPGDLLSPDELRTITSHLAGQEDFWRPQVSDLASHDAAGRRATQLLWSPTVEIWLVAWESGQSIDLHDHDGACGAFTVCEGVLEEVRGSVAEPARPLRLRTLRRGDSMAFDGDHVHAIANRSSGPATSIHAFSPALTAVRFYDDATGTLIPTYEKPVDDPEPTVVTTPVAAPA